MTLRRRGWFTLRRLRDVPISAKIFLAPGITLCALLALAVVAFIGLQDGKRNVRELSEGAFETFRLANAASEAITAVQARLIDTISVSATEADKARVEPRIAGVRSASANALKALDRLVAGLGAATAERLREEMNGYLASVEEVLNVVKSDPASAWNIVNEAERSLLQLSNGLARFQAEANSLREVATGEAIARTATASYIFLAVVIVAVLASSVATIVVARSITRPIARLTGAMSELAGGQLTITVPELDRGDEVGSMASAMQVFKEGLIEADRLNAERETARARELQHLRQFADATFESIVIHRDGMILDANSAFCLLTGEADTAGLRGHQILEFVAPSCMKVARERLRECARTVSELEVVHTSGATLPVEILSRPFEYDGDQVTLLAIRDVSERQHAEARIRELAFHDALTGLPNRYLLNDRLTQAIEMSARTGSRLAILCLDLDRFKFVNDLLGHEAGDRLLVEVAARLRSSVRSMDTVARLGGDEFVVVQAIAEQPSRSSILARRLIEALSMPYSIEGQTIEIGVSIGIAGYPDDGDCVTTLLKNGDTALYRAKTGGRGQYRFFEAAMDVQLRERRSLEQDLRLAFARRELMLHFQPMFDCSSRELEGFEALLRWTHPLRGAMSPMEFIPIAEECGLIVPLGHWVLETACAEASTWPKPWTVAVNLSPAQFREPDLSRVIGGILERTGLSPHRLELEVTEGVLISDTAEALALLTRLKARGIRISLDDFGTGYSSLSYLRRFPFDKLKIDKAFIQDSETNPDAAAIVDAIVKLGHCLHIQVTGEGVENEGQLQLLIDHRCNQAQGYLLGRPQPASQLMRFMAMGGDCAKPVPERQLDEAGVAMA